LIALKGVEKLDLLVSEFGAGAGGHGGRPKKTSFNLDNWTELVTCSNPGCVDGGFETGRFLHETVRKRLLEDKKEELCKGFEGSRGGKRVTHACINTFSVVLTISYKSTSLEDDVDALKTPKTHEPQFHPAPPEAP
jgi:hypothetical protein